MPSTGKHLRAACHTISMPPESHTHLSVHMRGVASAMQRNHTGKFRTVAHVQARSFTPFVLAYATISSISDGTGSLCGDQLPSRISSPMENHKLASHPQPSVLLKRDAWRVLRGSYTWCVTPSCAQTTTDTHARTHARARAHAQTHNKLSRPDY